jgi:hypothetical protein
MARAKRGDEGQSAPTEPGEARKAFKKRSDIPANLLARRFSGNPKRDFPCGPATRFASL